MNQVRTRENNFLKFASISQVMGFSNVPQENDEFSPAKLDVSRIQQSRDIYRNIFYGYKKGTGIKSLGTSKTPDDVTLTSVEAVNSAFRESTDIISFGTIKQMNRDPVIAFNYAILSSIMRCLPYTISSKDQMQEAFLKYVLSEYFSQVMETLCTSIYNGFSLQQIVWKKRFVNFTTNELDDEGNIVQKKVFEGVIDAIEKIKSIDPGLGNTMYHVNFVTEELYAIEQYNADKKNLYLMIKRSQLIHHTTGSAFNKIFGRSRYINIVPAFEIGKIIFKYLLKTMNDNSDCPVEIGYPSGTSVNVETSAMENNETVAARIAENITKYGTFYVPTDLHPDTNTPKWHVKVKTDWEKKNGENLKAYLALMNAYKTIGLFIPIQFSPDANNTKENGIEAAMELLMFVEEPLVTEFEKTIKRDLLDRFLAMNFPLDEIAEYTFKIDTSLFNRRQIMKELVLNLTRINGQLIGSGTNVPYMTPDLESILQQLNIPVKPTEEVYQRMMNNGSPIEQEGSVNIVKTQETNEKRNKEYRITKRSSRAGKKTTVIPGA